MSQPAAAPWSADEFFAWQQRQGERYELVAGFPVRMMAGARNAHDLIVVNLLLLIGNQLRGSRCRPFTGDGSVETYPGQIRRPDLGVDCGRFDPDGFSAAEPRLVAEVLSPSTRDFDTFDKVAEYKSVRSISTILVLEPNAPEVVAWMRDPDAAWHRTVIRGLDELVVVTDPGLSLALRDIYDGIPFPERPPRLLPSEEA